MNKVSLQTQKPSLYQVHDEIVSVIRQANNPTTNQLFDYFQKIILCMPGNVYWMSHDCRTIGCNQNVLDMFGLTSQEQFYGLSFEKMAIIGNWSNDQAASFKQDTLDVIQSGKTKANIEEPPIPGPNGKDVYFLTTRVPLFNTVGNVIGIVGISTDITENKKIEKELVLAKQQADAASKIKAEFIRNMEHDLRTPFTGLYALSHQLWENEPNEQKKKLLGYISKSAKELLEYCNGILEFSKIDSGDLQIKQKKFMLHDIFSNVIAMEKPAAEQRKLSLSLEYDVNLPKVVVGDEYRIMRLLLNLVSNAIKFTPSGFVRVHVKLAKTLHPKKIIVQISIEDSGIGISEENIEYIYEKFTRLDEANRGRYKGLGLGLRIVKQFMDEMGGELDVKNKLNNGGGRGTIFICTIPFDIPLLADESLS